MRHVRKKGQRGGVFMVPLLASSLALVATKSFKRYTKKKSLNQFWNENKTCNNKKETKNRRVYRKQSGGFFGEKSFWKKILVEKNGD